MFEPSNNALTAPRKRLLGLGLTALVVLLALALRWYYVSTAMVMQPIRGDAQRYYAYAWNLVHHGIFSGALPGSAIVHPDSYRDPGYPLFLAAWMRVFSDFGLWYAAVLLSQALLGALTVWLGMRLARRWLTPAWTLAAGVLMALWPHCITITSDILSETLASFLCLLAIWLAVRAGERRRAWQMFVAGVVFSTAGLTYAVLLPLGAVLALLLAWRGHLSRRLMLTLIASSLLLPSAWAVRNAQLPATASSSSRAMQNLVQGSWPVYHDAYMAMFEGDADGRRLLNRINAESDLMRHSPLRGLQAVGHRFAGAPMYYAAWYASKPALLWGWNIRMGQNDIYVYGTQRSPFDTQPAWRLLAALCHTLNLPIMLLMLMGVLLAAFVRGRVPINTPDKVSEKTPSMALDATAILVLYITAIYTVLQSEPRYSIPFRPYEMLLAVTALGWAVAWLRRYRQRKVMGGPDTGDAESGNDIRAN